MRSMIVGGAVTLSLAALCAATLVGAGAPGDPAWSPKAAAAYLDGRAAWWTTWPNAQRDRGTFCVSCHATVPYILARPALRRALGEAARSAPEIKMQEMVATRVTAWRDVAPFYPDQTRGLPKTSESRGTESIINALVLSVRDREDGTLTDDTRAALANMWALQMKTDALAGAWPWLNFHYEPWESADAPYFGASLAAIAVGVAPNGYAGTPEIQDNVKALQTYVQREYGHQPLFNHLMILLASSRLPGLITSEQRDAIIAAALAKQQEDGGWSMASLGSWKRIDGSALDTRSDGYATGLVTFALQQKGVPTAQLRKGLDWLQRNQQPSTGQWLATSLNKQRDPASDAGRFMSDAATAFAALALTQAK